MINNRYTNKYIELVPSKPTTTSMRVKGIDKYANANTSNVYTIHKQKCSRNRILKKAKPLNFHFKNLHQTDHLCKYKRARQYRQPVVILLVLCEDGLRVKRIVAV